MKDIQNFAEFAVLINFYFQNGLIRTKKNDYIIEPVDDVTMHGASGFVGQPHKLYKRSLIDAHNQRQYEAQRPGSVNMSFSLSKAVLTH